MEREKGGEEEEGEEEGPRTRVTERSVFAVQLGTEMGVNKQFSPPPTRFEPSVSIV